MSDTLKPAAELTPSPTGGILDHADGRDADRSACTVLRKPDGTVQHACGAEDGMTVADPVQDPHGAPDRTPLRILLDTTPGRRGTGWHRASPQDARTGESP